MSVVLLFMVVIGLVASLLLVLAAGLLIYRERRQIGVMTDRLLAEQRIDAVTRATLQAMREAARRSAAS